MSKFLSEKKKLLEDVYKKASEEATETSFNGILLHLERVLQDRHEGLSYKTFENYYKTIVEKEEDYNIKRSILDNLSKYLGYDDFGKYCSEWKTIEHTIQQAISKIVINIINKPILAMPHFFKKNGMGILEMAFVILLATGGVVFPKTQKNSQDSNYSSAYSFFGKSDADKKYMYWNGERYIATDSSYINPEFKVVAMNKNEFIHFRKIKRKDTMTIANSHRKVWCSKWNNEVDFFTMDGVNPDNGRELKLATDHMILKYSGNNADSISVGE